MLILGVDTTRDRLVAVLSDENKTYYKVSDEGNKKHTSKLLPVIDELLSENGFTLDDVAAFSAVTGPGSFTGIRVGVSTINALSFAKKNPLSTSLLLNLSHTIKARASYLSTLCTVIITVRSLRTETLSKRNILSAATKSPVQNFSETRTKITSLRFQISFKKRQGRTTSRKV